MEKLCCNPPFSFPDDQNRHHFWKSSGPKTVVGLLTDPEASGDPQVVQLACQVAATSGEGFELNKEAFMDLGAPDWLVSLTVRHLAHPGAVIGTTRLMRVCSTADDTRVEASKVPILSLNTVLLVYSFSFLQLFFFFLLHLCKSRVPVSFLSLSCFTVHFRSSVY